MLAKLPAILIFVGILLFVLAGSFVWSVTARAAYESAEFEVVETDGDFEIREYPDLMLVSTDSNSTFQGSDGSFMRLFRYISGDNATKEKVHMTTPVFMENSNSDTEGQMAFVIPKEVAVRGAPKPSQAAVKLRTREAGRFAVIRFSGRLNAESSEKESLRLREWLKRRGLTTKGEPEFAGYDPPWTPGPLRRNEVLIRLAPNPE